MPTPAGNMLGSYLRDRRTRLDPATFGFTGGRRRTPGLRREEVAQRANISPTWYTWLEQGRGGAPSAEVLNRIAEGLMLTEPEREHLFMIGLGHLPEVHFKPTEGVTPRLQRVLDAFEISPAIVKNALWDVVAWNRAAAALLTDYSKLPPAERNILRLIFSNARVRAAQEDWYAMARFVVGAFRADAVRTGAAAEIGQFVEDMSAQSPEFREMWLANDVHAYGEGMKRLHHPELGVLDMEFSAFAVDGRPDLGMIVYNPMAEDAERIRGYIGSRALSE
ncbi:helix-turn-helix transcriptional regulator [Pinirhizobacter sp.]|jgi:transcriptional regulator with XRE-family HTH domain|uniref:helix-turn-helix transcriptional regulator n=1 Tax=Pinirhizobacter sp. TaxID=2950432 RepID=UPI002F422CE8